MTKKTLLLVYAAMLAALTCIATMLIKVPTIGTNGYVNIGDSAVLLSAWILGNPYGALAAGIGSGLADLLAGYTSYVPGTTIIKFTMAFVGVLLMKFFKKVNCPVLIKYILSGIVAELIMVGGYFLYEATFLGYGLPAAASIPSNFIQAGTCLLLGTLLIMALRKIPFIRAILIENKTNE